MPGPSPLSCVLALALALGTGGVGAPGTGAGLEEQALHLDDDCEVVAGEAGEGGCALNALQLRGKAVAADAAAGAAAVEDEVPDQAADQTTSCSNNPVTRMVETAAPECVAACPELCMLLSTSAAVSALAAGLPLASEVCRLEADFVCVAENVKKCQALADFSKELGMPIPKGSRQLSATCKKTRSAAAALLEEQASDAAEEGDTPGEALMELAGQTTAGQTEGTAIAQALVERAGKARAGEADLERVLAGKQKDQRCEHAGEGQLCVSKNTLIYCSAKKRLSGPAYCERRKGHLSLCRQDGVGLQKSYCDDPFCRNGGAYQGSGRYCHNGAIVSCHGGGPPRVTESCISTTRSDWNGCTVTTHRSCHGGWPNPYCGVDSESVDHSTCDHH